MRRNGRILVLDGDLVGENKKKKDQERGLSENFNSVSILVFGFETAHSMLLPGLLPIRFARRSIAGAHYRERGGKRRIDGTMQISQLRQS